MIVSSTGSRATLEIYDTKNGRRIKTRYGKRMNSDEPASAMVNITPPGVGDDYLIEPAYAESRGWGIYYFDDELTYEQLQALVPKPSLSSGVYIKRTSGDKHKTTKFVGEFQGLWDIIVMINSDRCCIFDQPANFVLTVIEADVSIVATDRQLLKEIFGALDTSREEWIEETRRFRPDLRAEILAKYVGGS